MSEDPAAKAREDGMKLLQLEALGIGRRNKITTNAFKEDLNVYRPVAELEAARNIRKGPSASSADKAKVTAWNAVHDAIGEDGTVTQDLGDVNEGLGQTHRAKLQATVTGNIPGGHRGGRTFQKKPYTAHARNPQTKAYLAAQVLSQGAKPANPTPTRGHTYGRGRITKGGPKQGSPYKVETKGPKFKATKEAVKELVKDIQQETVPLKRVHSSVPAAPLAGPEDFLAATRGFPQTRVDPQSARGEDVETRGPSSKEVSEASEAATRDPHRRVRFQLPEGEDVAKSGTSPKKVSRASKAATSPGLASSMKPNPVQDLIDLDIEASDLDQPALMPSSKASPPKASDLALLLSILSPEQLEDYRRLKAQGSKPDKTPMVSKPAKAAPEMPSSSKGKPINDENQKPAASSSGVQARPQAAKTMQSSSSILTQHSGNIVPPPVQKTVIIGEHVSRARYELPHEILANRLRDLTLEDVYDDTASLAPSSGKDKKPATTPAGLPATTSTKPHPIAAAAAIIKAEKGKAKEPAPPPHLRLRQQQMVAKREAPAPPSARTSAGASAIAPAPQVSRPRAQSQVQAPAHPHAAAPVAPNPFTGLSTGVTQPSTRSTAAPSTGVTQSSTRSTERPTERPAAHPTERPSTRSTERPTERPTAHPAVNPTERPAARPTARPSTRPGAPALPDYLQGSSSSGHDTGAAARKQYGGF